MPFTYRLTILTLLAISAFRMSAQEFKIKGKVIFQSEPLESIAVFLDQQKIGAYTDEEGQFLFSAPRGKYDLVIRSMGYRTHRQEIEVSKNLSLGEIEILEDVLGLEDVVISGTLRPVSVSQSPIKIDVINSKFLEVNTPATNIMEGLTLINGVQEVVACGVCYTNSISINGLPGPYTAVLMDGTPIYGNLASVYGLNGIPTTIIDRFEVIKGPNSTLYGSEAVAGVINIITKDPEDQPLLSLDLMGTSHLESFGNVAIAPKIGKAKGYIGLNYAYLNDFDDSNGDGFGDNISMDRVSLFTKWSVKRPNDRKLTFAAKYYYEDRRNGLEKFLKNRAYRTLRGSDEIYGESIYTKRAEVFGTYEFGVIKDLKLDYSLSYHDQDSYYGSDSYIAEQRIAFANLTYRKALENHDILLGISNRYQYYDDNTIATQRTFDLESENQPDIQYIPGIFVQDEWQASRKLTVLGGARLDHYQAHGPIFSPRLNFKYKPGDWSTFRLNLGTGFRIVNLFTEDHAFVTGQREVVITEALKPESSYNASLNFNHVYTLGNGQGTLDINAFYTYFNNKIIPDYDTPGKIIYANSEGHALTQGFDVNITHQFAIPLSINLGVNVQRVAQVEPNESGIMETSPIEFAPNWSGLMTINYEWKKSNFLLAYTARITGPMTLPEVFDLDESGNLLPTSRPTRSAPFALQNLQLTKKFLNQRLDVYGGFQNVFNYRQQFSPLVGFNDPNALPGFSQYFDTAYAYSPLHGREVYLGFRWNWGRK